MRADRARLEPLPPGPAWFHPSLVCVYLHRVSHYLHSTGHNYAARLVWHMNHMLTGADIPPQADIGPGLLIMNPAGLALMAKAGRNLTMMPLAGIGSELGRWEDIGAGPGLPVLGDDVVMEPFSGILGPVHIGNRVRISAMVVATRDLPDDVTLTGPEPRVLSNKLAS